MYAKINIFGKFVGFESSDIGDERFNFVPVDKRKSGEIRLRIKDGFVVDFKDGSFKYSKPRLPRSWDDIRKERSPKLKEADEMIFKLTDQELISGDDNHSLKVSWSKYRKDLRDITDSFESPDDVVWPAKPA